MEKLNYTIGEVLKMLNITEGTIRNYERKDLLNSKRYNNNKYRHYDYRDLNRIVTIRKYRKFGMSLDDIKNLFTSNNIKNSKTILEHQQKTLIEQANLLLKNANKIALDIEKIDKVEHYLNKYEIVTRPSFYFYPFDKRSPITNDIIKNDLFDDYVSILKKETVYGNTTPIVGFYKNNLSNSNDEAMFYKEIQCLYTVIEVEPFRDGTKSFSEVLKYPINYIKNNNYEIIDDSLGIKLLTLEKDSKQYDYYEIYFPIKINK